MTPASSVQAPAERRGIAFSANPTAIDGTAKAQRVKLICCRERMGMAYGDTTGPLNPESAIGIRASESGLAIRIQD